MIWSGWLSGTAYLSSCCLLLSSSSIVTHTHLLLPSWLSNLPSPFTISQSRFVFLLLKLLPAHTQLLFLYSYVKRLWLAHAQLCLHSNCLMGEWRLSRKYQGTLWWQLYLVGSDFVFFVFQLLWRSMKLSDLVFFSIDWWFCWLQYLDLFSLTLLLWYSWKMNWVRIILVDYWFVYALFCISSVSVLSYQIVWDKAGRFHCC